MWIPLLFRSTMPRIEHRKANFAVVVEVWIEADCVSTGRGQVHLHGRLRIIRREINIEFETAISIRRVTRTGYQNLFKF